MLALVLILSLGIGAQWLAWRLRLPSILLLLLFGILAGPIFHLFDPDKLLGAALLPAVSLSVAVILFEGGMTLRAADLTHVGPTVRNLVSVGAAVTWIVSGLAARYLLALPWPLAILLGAILVVTGPTVIGPLLRHVRPVGPVGPALRWEGIVIDPIGALLAVLVFEAIGGPLRHTAPLVAAQVARTALAGGGIGLASALFLSLLFRRFWVPDYLETPLTFVAVAAAFVGSNRLQPESGLFAVTTMGIALANQKSLVVHHIAEFKENLSILLVSSLFILLAARLDLRAVARVWPRGLAFTAVLILLARPLAVAASTAGSPLSWRERAFLAWMAPRGIVAASVSSVFALRLAGRGFADADLLLSYTFFVIVVTVIVYGLSAGPLARILGLANPGNRGVLFVGAHALARALARVLQEDGHQVLLVDTNRANIQAARLAGLPVLAASALSGFVLDKIELTGIGRLLAMTPNEEVNALAAVHFARVFGRSEVYELATPAPDSARKEKTPWALRGRVLFHPDMNYQALQRLLDQGYVIKKTRLTPEFDFTAFQSHHGGRAVPLLVVNEAGQAAPVTADAPATPRANQTLVTLAPPQSERTDSPA